MHLAITIAGWATLLALVLNEDTFVTVMRVLSVTIICFFVGQFVGRMVRR
jgi:hypothetical protein